MTNVTASYKNRILLVAITKPKQTEPIETIITIK